MDERFDDHRRSFVARTTIYLAKTETDAPYKLNGHKIIKSLFARDSFVRLVTYVRVSRISEIFNPDDRGSRLEYGRAYDRPSYDTRLRKSRWEISLGEREKVTKSRRGAIDSRRYFVANTCTSLHIRRYIRLHNRRNETVFHGFVGYFAFDASRVSRSLPPDVFTVSSTALIFDDGRWTIASDLSYPSTRSLEQR